MGKYWVSWYGSKTPFTLETPWWITGYTGDEDDKLPIVCAAVRAESDEDAQRIIRSAHDRYPRDLVFRFVEPRNADWSPFNDRFQRAEWMRWPDDKSEKD